MLWAPSSGSNTSKGTQHERRRRYQRSPGLTNEQYHSGDGVSKSQLDDVAESGTTYIWRKSAPVDEEKLKPLDMGTALHCLLLEPEEFKDRFIIAPEFNRRTNVGKEEEKEFMANCSELGKTIMAAEEGRKLQLMRESVFAHPDGCWSRTASARAHSTGLTVRQRSCVAVA